MGDSVGNLNSIYVTTWLKHVGAPGSSGFISHHQKKKKKKTDNLDTLNLNLAIENFSLFAC